MSTYDTPQTESETETPNRPYKCPDCGAELEPSRSERGELFCSECPQPVRYRDAVEPDPTRIRAECLDCGAEVVDRDLEAGDHDLEDELDLAESVIRSHRFKCGARGRGNSWGEDFAELEVIRS